MNKDEGSHDGVAIEANRREAMLKGTKETKYHVYANANAPISNGRTRAGFMSWKQCALVDGQTP